MATAHEPRLELLLADDDSNLRELSATWAREAVPQLAIVEAADGAEAVQLGLERRPQLALLDELVDVVALALLDRRLPDPDLCRGGRHPEPPAAAEVGVDVVLGAERLDAVDGLLGGPRDPHALLLAARLDQRPELRPPGRQEAAVSPAGTGAADVGLDDGDVAAGLELLDPKRGPRPV